jgi:hypothetical protein
MKRQYGTLLLIPLLTMGCWSLAFAEKEAAVTFDQIDTDGDGYISKEEAKVSRDITKNWKKADKDQDGHVDISEFSAFESQERFTPPSDMEEPEPGAAPF